MSRLSFCRLLLPVSISSARPPSRAVSWTSPPRLVRASASRCGFPLLKSPRALEINPRLFSADGSGSGEGMVVDADTSALTAARNYANNARPAQAGDHVIAYATGIEGASRVSARIAGIDVPVSVAPVPGSPGLFRISLHIPAGVASGNRTSLMLTAQTAGGTPADSNRVLIAIEPATRIAGTVAGAR